MGAPEMELVDALDATFDHAQTVIAGVGQDQYAAATPCREWTVEDLLAHMIGVVGGMGATVAGRPRPDGVDVGPDAAAQFDAVAAGARSAWRTPGVLEATFDGGPGPMPGRVLARINLLDTATHTWDLATATGQPAALPDDVALAAMEASRQIVTDELRSGRFGPEVAALEGAGPTEQLVAFLGRRP